ncbi:hypothetical protein EDD85DRAFT_548521 [Armillaria nabsnona]|nr:hypothetical protein EDD85DRAFT_548521 [Armillaria nabsnona]
MRKNDVWVAVPQTQLALTRTTEKAAAGLLEWIEVASRHLLVVVLSHCRGCHLPRTDVRCTLHVAGAAQFHFPSDLTTLVYVTASGGDYLVGPMQPLDYSLSSTYPYIHTMNTGTVTRGSLSNLASRRASKRGDPAPRAGGVERDATETRMDPILISFSPWLRNTP